MHTKLQEYEQEHMAAVRRMAPECMVLLKTDGSLPLADLGDLALYGNGARYTQKGDTGSGDVNSRSFPTAEQGLENAGFTITSKKWLDGYDAVREAARKAFFGETKEKTGRSGSWLAAFGAIMKEPEYDLALDGAGDTCVYVLSRVCGEGTDRTVSKGDFLLTDSEKRDILAASAKYKNFVLVLNVGGVIDLTPVMGVQNILLLSQTGCTIGDSLADVLLGKAFPSGHLTDTWSRYENYPHVGDFGEQADTRYKEGVFVGYRWFDTMGEKSLFPFGFGLSYTKFQIKIKDVGCTDSKISVLTHVKNVGKRAGKEVLQAYVSVPSGRIAQPYQVLAAFEKTARLLPEEEEDITLTFDMRELASYDEQPGAGQSGAAQSGTERQDTAQSGAGRLGARILEAGDYIVRVGVNSRDTRPVARVKLTQDVVVEKVRPLTHQADFKDFVPTEPALPGSLAQAASSEILATETKSFVLTADSFKGEIHEPIRMDDEHYPKPDKADLEAIRKLSDEELARLCTGAFTDTSGKSMVGNAGIHVCGAAGESAPIPGDPDKRRLIMADGPAGLRLTAHYGKLEDGSLLGLDPDLIESLGDVLPEPFRSRAQETQKKRAAYSGEVFTQFCTAIPIGTALAQSFSPVVARMAGSLVGAEMERFHVNLWLASALNLHRDPLCGRCFEYYSEDPLVSGIMAAAITQGVQSHPGCGVTIKHFVCNNQETNRMNSNSIVSERALRDLYLRGFEIAVKRADPAAVMTSYNLLNGEHTSQTKELLEGVLRGEWGFKGLVMSDWVVVSEARTDEKWPGAVASGAVAAGNDLFMPGMKEHFKDILQGLENTNAPHKVTREELERSAARLVMLIKRLSKD